MCCVWKFEVVTECLPQLFICYFIFILCVNVLPTCMYCTTCMPRVHGGQKRVLGPLELEFWLGPRQEQEVFSVARLSLQPHLSLETGFLIDLRALWLTRLAGQ